MMVGQWPSYWFDHRQVHDTCRRCVDLYRAYVGISGIPRDEKTRRIHYLALHLRSHGVGYDSSASHQVALGLTQSQAKPRSGARRR